MRLHRNAALSWSGRRRLARRVVEQGWTLKAAAAAAGVSVRCARKWVSRYRGEGDAGLSDRSSAPKRVGNRTSEERIAAMLGLRRLRFTAAEIAEALRMPLSTVSGVLTRCGASRLGGSAGAADPVRAATRWRAGPYRCQEARPDRGRRWQARRGAREWQRPTAAHGRCRQPARHDRLGVRPRRRRRHQPPGPRRGALRRTSHHSSRLLPARTRLLSSPRHPRRARLHR
jgi:transposase